MGKLTLALIIPWAFWGMLSGMLAYAGRSWFNVMLIPVGITVVILVVAAVASVREALWGSAILHGLLFIYLLGSYLQFHWRAHHHKR